MDRGCKEINKYMAANYKVDSEKLAPFTKNYLKSSVSSGTILQTKGVLRSSLIWQPPVLPAYSLQLHPPVWTRSSAAEA